MHNTAQLRETPGYKIIICDDEPIIRNGLGKLIQRSNLPLTISGMAGNGPESLKLLEEQKPSLALMDINMPGMTGLNVIETGKAISPHTKFIIITGYDEFEYARAACRLHVIDYLLKPIDKEAFLALLEQVIREIRDEQLTFRLFVDEKETGTTAQKILSYIHNSFSDPDLSLAKTAGEFHLSPSYVTRILKQETGQHFSGILTSIRLEKAKAMLADPEDKKLCVIAEECGFTSQHYFSRVFRQTTGYAPNEYRKLFRRFLSGN